MSYVAAYSSLPLILLSLLLFSIPVSASVQEKNDFHKCLISNYQFRNSSKDSISDVIYTHENSLYNFVFDSTAQNLLPWSTSTLRPILIITPTHESQIQTAVYCSKKTEIQIRVRSGGHDYEGLSFISSNTFVIVDMRNFGSISIDTETNTSWVQTGATLGEFYYAIAEKSRTLAFSAGVCPTVGVGGHFSGGGYGMLSRKHGIASDLIVDAKIINFDGQILDRKSMGEDLFWAIRGGGAASFAIVISFKVQLVVIPEIVTVFHVTRTFEQKLVQLVYRWQYIADKIDERLLIRLRIGRDLSGDGNSTRIGADFNTLFLGRVDDLLPIMQDRFPELGLSKKDCVETSWVESQLLFAGFTLDEPLETLLRKTTTYKGYYKGKSDFVTKPIPEEILSGLFELANNDSFFVELQFSPYGGKLNDFSEAEIPFPHRAGNIFMIQYMIIWWENPGKEESERNLKWVHKMYDYMAPYVSESPRSAYFNYRDLEIGVSDSVLESSYRQESVWGFKYFKNNFKRLAFVKTKVDPTNFFRNEQSIPVMSPSEMEEYIDSETNLAL